MVEEKEEIIEDNEKIETSKIISEKPNEIMISDIIQELTEKEKSEEKKEKLTEKEYEEDFEEILRLTSFGTELRESLEKISSGNAGALIVLADLNKIKDVILGGFKMNCKFSGEKLFELSKMDGAIVVDSHLKKIHFANVLLIPNPLTPSRETGTRHQAAERTAKQTGQLVIAVSQRTGTKTIYTKYFRYKLRAVADLLARLQSVLDSLEEQKKIFSNLVNYLNILEFTDLVTAVHVISVLQKAEFIIRGNKLARRYLIELGTDSQLLELRLKEIMKNVGEDFHNLLRDYGKKNPMNIRKELDKINYDELLNFENIAKIFEFKSIEESLRSRGYRILSKIPSLNENQIRTIVKKYQSLKAILEADMVDMKSIPEINESKVVGIKEELEKLKNSAMLSQTI